MPHGALLLVDYFLNTLNFLEYNIKQNDDFYIKMEKKV